MGSLPTARSGKTGSGNKLSGLRWRRSPCSVSYTAGTGPIWWFRFIPPTRKVRSRRDAPEPWKTAKRVDARKQSRNPFPPIKACRKTQKNQRWLFLGKRKEKEKGAQDPDAMRQERARIHVGRISHIGFLEISRQRNRDIVLESSTEP